MAPVCVRGVGVSVENRTVRAGLNLARSILSRQGLEWGRTRLMDAAPVGLLTVSWRVMLGSVGLRLGTLVDDM